MKPRLEQHLCAVHNNTHFLNNLFLYMNQPSVHTLKENDTTGCQVLETLLAQNLEMKSGGLQIRNPYAGQSVHPQLWTFLSLTCV